MSYFSNSSGTKIDSHNIMAFEIRIMHFASSSEDDIFMVDASWTTEIMKQSFLELHGTLFQGVLNCIFIIVFYYLIDVEDILLDIK